MGDKKGGFSDEAANIYTTSIAARKNYRGRGSIVGHYAITGKDKEDRNLSLCPI
jgi:hypothetical protein